MEDVPPATAIVKPMRKIDRLPVHRSASFKSQYPVGGPQAKIWNRALARADEVSRVPGVDPRGGDPRLALSPRKLGPSGVGTNDTGFPLSRE